MTQLAALKKLAEKVEAGEWRWDLRIDAGMPNEAWEAFNGDLSAAKALLEAGLPGWDARIFLSGSAWVYIPTRGAPPKMEAEAEIKDQPARSLLLATILGKIAALEAET